MELRSVRFRPVPKVPPPDPTSTDDHRPTPGLFTRVSVDHGRRSTWNRQGPSPSSTTPVLRLVVVPLPRPSTSGSDGIRWGRRRLWIWETDRLSLRP